MRGASWTLIHVLVSLPVAFVANLVVARILGVEGYGRLAFLMTFMTVAGGIVVARAGDRRCCSSAPERTPAAAPRTSATCSPRARASGCWSSRRCSRSGCCCVADVPTQLLVTAILFGIWMPAALDGAVFCITIEGKSDVGAKIAMVTNLAHCRSRSSPSPGSFADVGRRVARSPGGRRPDDARVRRRDLARLPFGRAEAHPAPRLPARASGVSPCRPGSPSIIGTLALTRTEVFFLTWLSTPEAVGVFALAFGLANHIFAPAEAMVGPLIPAVSGLHEVDRGVADRRRSSASCVPARSASPWRAPAACRPWRSWSRSSTARSSPAPRRCCSPWARPARC